MRRQKAITLISLVITIIILIILAGVGINLSLGENGIFKRAKEAKNKYLIAQENEEKGLNEIENYIQEYTNYKQVAGGLIFIDVDNVIEEGTGANYTYTAKEDSIAYIEALGINKGFMGHLNNAPIFRFQCGNSGAGDYASTLVAIKKGQTLKFTEWGSGTGELYVKIYKVLQ
ncbi:MAG: hypothetical protein HFJ42_02675 [Clostridia bacterium]|nr:hypothetical protein [Clostridia bacterium]